MAKRKKPATRTAQGFGKVLIAFMKGTGTRLSPAEVQAVAPLVLASIPRPKKKNA